MANFLIRVLKWLAALITAYAVLFILFLLLLIAAVGVFFQPAPKAVKEGSIMVMDLGFRLSDQPPDDDPAKILSSALKGTLTETASLRQVIDGLHAARRDSRIKGLVLKGNFLPEGSGASFAGIRELRRAIASFSADKPVWAYLDGESLRDIYLKSVATEIIANPYGSVDFRGLRAEMVYLGEAFERLGIGVQVEAFEAYKTAGDPFLKTGMSPEEREQLSELVADLWTVVLGDIAEARAVDPFYLDEIAGSNLYLMGEKIVSAGLADRLLGTDDFIAYLAGESAFDKERNSFQQVGFIDYLGRSASPFASLELPGTGNKVGILYMDGILMDGEGSDGAVGSESFIRQLRELRDRDDVKAIVIRVNSPGGSATAGFKVAREVERTNSVKPVVSSMGGIATSAGYLVAACGDTIFAEPSTITGSIGVVSMIFNVESLADKLSIHFDGVETHPFAGSYSPTRSKTPEEMEAIRALAGGWYDEFLAFVARNRDLSPEAVRSRAKGRVWSGLAAMENGLVDAQGGLYAAVQRSADLAGIGNDYTLLERPRRVSLEEKIQQWLTGKEMFRREKGAGGVIYTVWKDLEGEMRRLSFLNDPYGNYAILPYALKIQ